MFFSPEDSQKEDGVIVQSLEEVLPESMLPYAEYVILDRALPRVEDGLKPVQRRILYTMYDMGLFPDKPHKKSARIVGDCMGKYHPHGDSSVYDAMVRMAQNFNMRDVLINGHGNFGSVDGDPAAAMRYTEARLEPLALELLRDIEKDTVRFVLNFDDSLKEPETLPGRFPNLLVNGAAGIAVGLATNIPPHNLKEVINGICAYIENPKISLQEMMKYIPAPDFPTGGYIIENELVQAYQTGRGKITLRAKLAIEKQENDRQMIVITELPYQVNKARLLTKIEELREEKKEIFAAISEIVDESDRNGMRAVIKLKKDSDVHALIEALCKYTDIETTFGINMVCIADGKPQQLGLISIIRYYVAYQREVILRRTKFDLHIAKERCHILEGLIIAVQNIDEVIAIIKKSDGVVDARKKLCARFSLTERQAQAILDLRLARLTKLEVLKLEEELAALKERIMQLTAIIEHKKLQMQVIKDELSLIKKQFKTERQSRIIKKSDEIVLEHFDESKQVHKAVFLFTASQEMKLVSEKAFQNSNKHIQENSKFSDIFLCNLPTKTDKTIYVFTNLGYCHKLNLMDFEMTKLKEKGLKLKDMSSKTLQNEYPVAFFAVKKELPKGSLLFYTKFGYVKKSDWQEYAILKSHFQAMKLNEGDELLSVEINSEDLVSTLFFVTKKGMCLNAYKNDIPTQGRISAGVRGIALVDDDYVVYAGQVNGDGEMIIVTTNNKMKRVIVSLIDTLSRYRKGVKIIDLQETSAVLFVDYVTNPYKLALYLDDDSFYEIDSEDDISIEDRLTKGKNIRIKKGCKVKGVFSLKYLQ